MSLSFERLENRVLLAVSFSRNAGAGIATVRSNGEGDLIDVVGEGPNRFTVNGVLFAGYEQLRIYAGGGDDQIYVTDLTIGEKLLIDAGAGGDYVEINGGGVERMTLNTGTGEDQVYINLFDIREETVINTGGHNDYVELGFNRFFGKFTASLGAGDDQFYAADNEFHEYTKIDGQAGNEDYIALCPDNFYYDDVRVFGGNGNADTLELPFDLRPGILNEAKGFENFVDCGGGEGYGIM